MHNTDTKNLGSIHNRGGIILPIIILGALVFVFLRVDLKTAFESEQFKKNKAYVTNFIKDTIGDKFFETPSNPDTNKTAHFDFSSFLPLPQIKNMDIKAPTSQNSENTKIDAKEGELEADTSGYRTVR